ncbi:peroxiredoxin [Rhodanobacter denitrificans]|uniref:thioredoxin-dependent peroxiredoxin n=1 Tax=Rhodanobacter denitrificans TaxID=666685 RepID=M4NB53_9GAMM|nr:peroxiredoxin [Rhodanobacter denitrificans]AGG87845.1 Peroxiredoxin [Rhodanobacter denitrificans]UJM87006.1 peroxiredoxin [Rhodanobacter denitrificans]UJM89939.1 peroxiredoxin [Rhodanobacter denitrificans]
MKKRFAGSMALGALLALASAMPAVAALAPGAVAPTFTARASQAGKEFTFSLADALRKGPVVVYFYPSAYTGGCDLEAHTFAVERDKFDAAGATIIGVSADSIERLDAFSADPKYCAGKFPVASDAEVKVALAYGLEAMAARPGMHDVRGVAIDHAFIPRTTFVIAGDGRIVATLSSETDHLRPDEHVKQSLAIVQRLQAGKAP